MHMCFNKKEKNLPQECKIIIQFYALNDSLFTIKSEEKH